MEHGWTAFWRLQRGNLSKVQTVQNVKWGIVNKMFMYYLKWKIEEANEAALQQVKR